MPRIIPVSENDWCEGEIVDPNRNEVMKLPPYRALLVVDMESFSSEQGRDHARITEQIPMILEQAFVRCGLGEVWQSATFSRTTGDGYAVGFDPSYLPFLLNPFLTALQDELNYHNGIGSVRRPMRMRVSVSVGPVTDSGTNAMSDGSGDARVEVHRLVDDESVKDLLVRSNSTTCVAAIVSERAFEDAVKSGFAAEDPSLYVETDVSVKAYRGKARLRVPTPSGDLVKSGFHRPEREAEEDQDTRPAAEPTVARDQYVGVDKVNGSVRHIVSGPDATVHTGSGNQYNGLSYSGDGVAVFGSNEGGVQHKVDKGKGDR